MCVQDKDLYGLWMMSMIYNVITELWWKHMEYIIIQAWIGNMELPALIIVRYDNVNYLYLPGF